MSSLTPLTSDLDAFAKQFQAQLLDAGVPSSEHAVHFCLALGVQSVRNFAPGTIIFEWPVGAKKIDLRVTELDLAIEVKFHRPIPSGRSLPETQLFGDLLADFNKLTLVATRQRLVVYVSDGGGIRYLDHQRLNLLPLRVGEGTTITREHIHRLPQTAARRAVADGPWQPLTSELIWAKTVSEWHLLAWRVLPLNPEISAIG